MASRPLAHSPLPPPEPLDEEPNTVPFLNVSDLLRQIDQANAHGLGPEGKTAPASTSLQQLVESERLRARREAEATVEVEIDLSADDQDDDFPDRF